MDLTITLKKEEWEFVMEAISLGTMQQIKATAIGILKPKLDEAFDEASKPKQTDE